jgi:hypothetical protein
MTAMVFSSQHAVGLYSRAVPCAVLLVLLLFQSSIPALACRLYVWAGLTAADIRWRQGCAWGCMALSHFCVLTRSQNFHDWCEGGGFAVDVLGVSRTFVGQQLVADAWHAGAPVQNTNCCILGLHQGS